MRLPERYKQTIYISNETYINSGDFKEPIKVRGIFTPMSDTITYGGGVEIQGNTDEIKFESKHSFIKDITQNSRIWIKRVPDKEVDGEDYTHKVIGRHTTTNSWFVVIQCKSTAIDSPIVWD